MAEEKKPAIIVRAMEAADWRAVHEIWSQPEVIWGTLRLPYQSPDAVRKKIEDPPEGVTRLVSEIDGRVVGSAGLHQIASPRMRHAAGIGVTVHRDYRNRGVGTALLAALVDLADNWLNIRRLGLTVFTDNAAAIHLYQKFGFVIEGTHRAHVFRDGDYEDTYFMARARDLSPEPATG